MSGEVNLGNDRDSEVGGIVHDVLDLVLGIIAAVAYSVVGPEVLANHRSVAVGTDLGQLGIFLYLDPPALVVGDVPVHAVELVDSHDVEILLDFLDGEEMPGAIEVHAPVTEAGFVLDGYAGEEEFL